MSLLPKWWKDFSFDQPICFFFSGSKRRNSRTSVEDPSQSWKPTCSREVRSRITHYQSLLVNRPQWASRSTSHTLNQNETYVERDFLAMLGKHNESLWRLKCWWYFCGGHGLILDAKSLEAHLCFKFVFFNLSQSSPILTTLDYFR